MVLTLVSICQIHSAHRALSSGPLQCGLDGGGTGTKFAAEAERNQAIASVCASGLCASARRPFGAPVPPHPRRRGRSIEGPGRYSERGWEERWHQRRTLGRGKDSGQVKEADVLRHSGLRDITPPIFSSFRSGAATKRRREVRGWRKKGGSGTWWSPKYGAQEITPPKIMPAR